MHPASICFPLPPVVYHYCSVETFFQIISNHTLRLSDIEKSNDFMEKKWAIRQCLQYIRKNLHNRAFSCSTQPRRAESFLKEIELQSQQYNTMILAACFSSRRDLLSQWRGYGDNGGGVCIGISSAEAFAPAYARAGSYLELSDSSLSLPTSLLFANIRYATDDIEALCMQLFCCSLEQLSPDESERDAAAQLVHSLYPALPFFKSPAFSEEAEWRCVYYPTLPAPPYEDETFDEAQFRQALAAETIEHDLDGFRMLPLDYRLRGRNLVPYRDISFDGHSEPFIRSITIGPRCPLDRETVKVFLERNHISIDLKDIRLSDVSYR